MSYVSPSPPFILNVELKNSIAVKQLMDAGNVIYSKVSNRDAKEMNYMLAMKGGSVKCLIRDYNTRVI